MKRTSFALVALLVSLSLLCACSMGRSVSIGEFLSSGGTEVPGPSDAPKELFLAIDNGYTDTIDDQAFVAEVWTELYNLQISSSPAKASPIDDGGIAFSFMWDDERTLTLGFQTSELFEAGDGTLHQVKDPNEMGTILNSLINYLKDKDAQAQNASSSALAISENNTFNWDANGDGVAETFVIRSHDNGDEAPNVMEIVDASRSYESAWIDRAYGVQQIVPNSDESGSYLTITYLSGDYYAHDTVSTCDLHFSDGVLWIAYPEGSESTAQESAPEEGYVEEYPADEGYVEEYATDEGYVEEYPSEDETYYTDYSEDGYTEESTEW